MTLNDNTSSEIKIYDMLIIGGGAGGYTAAIYAARDGLSCLIFEKLGAGGQMNLTDKIDNYPGFDTGIDGYTLSEKMKNGAERFGAETVYDEVISVELRKPVKEIKTNSAIYYGKTVVIATGENPRKLGIPGELDLIGRGVSYCANCDGMFYRGKEAVIVGGGNSASEDALILSRICNKVTLIHRRDNLDSEKIYQKAIFDAKNISILWNTVLTSIARDESNLRLTIKSTFDSSEREIVCDGVFISIGRTPSTELVKNQVEVDSNSYIFADESTRTSLPGVFAAGDVRTKPFRQIVTAVADGANAVFSALEYLESGAKE